MKYTVNGNVIQVRFQKESAPQPQPVAQVVDTQLRDHLYRECAEIAGMSRANTFQTIRFRKGDFSPKEKTTVYRYVKNELPKIEKMGYIKQLAALKRLYAITRIFWRGTKVYRDASGTQIHALDQVSQEHIDEQMRIVEGTRNLWSN